MKKFLKPDRDQTEVFSTSNHNGYVTECRGSLPNQNFIYLYELYLFFATFTYQQAPYRNNLF